MAGGNYDPSGGLIFFQDTPDFVGGQRHYLRQTAPGGTDPWGTGWQNAQWEQKQHGLDYQSGLLGLQKQQLGLNFYKNLLGNMDNWSSKFTYHPPYIPGPGYIPETGVYSQQQIDAQSNLQRAGLQTQAATQSRQYANDLANRGFSTMGSPFLNFAQQNAMMKANAAAAANETELNFNAAKANRDAQIEAAKVNASKYGSYLDALMGSYNLDFQRQRSQQDFLSNLLSSAGRLI